MTILISFIIRKTNIYLRKYHFILYDCQLLIYLNNDPTHRFHKIGLSKFRRISHFYYLYSRNPDFVITIFVSANVEKHKESGIFLLILNAFFHPIKGVFIWSFTLLWAYRHHLMIFLQWYIFVIHTCWHYWFFNRHSSIVICWLILKWFQEWSKSISCC